MPGTIIQGQADVGALGVFGSGSVASRLLANNLNLEAALRTNATLRDDEWEELDTQAVMAFEERLMGIEDLRSRGLVRPLGGIGTLLSQYNQNSQMSRAQVSMWANTDAEQSRMLFNLVGVPVPVIFKEFQMDIRFLDNARRLGDPIDTLQAEECAALVGEELEDMLFNGNTTAYHLPIYGYRTHPSRNTTSGASWGTSTNIYGNILTMTSGLMGDRVPGPYMLYLHNDQYMETLAFADTTHTLTVRELAIQNIPQLEDIKMSDKMTAGEAVMVSLNRRTVDLAVAQEYINVEWDGPGGFGTHFRGMAIAAPRVKADYNGRCGVYHMTGI